MPRDDRRAAELFGPRPTDPAELRSAARSGSRWSFAAQVGGRLATVAAFLVLVRLVAPEDFGVVALAVVFVEVAQIVVDGGFAQALVQRDDLRPGHADTAFWSSVAVAVLMAAAVAAAAGPIGALFGEARLPAVLRVLGLGIVLGSLGTAHAALLRRRFRFRALAVRTTLGTLAGGVAGVATALAGAGVRALVVQYLVTGAAGTVLLWAASPWRPGTDVSGASFRDLFRFSRNTLGSTLLGVANQRGDDVAVGVWLGSSVLGVYVVAYRLLTVLRSLITQSIATVTLPVLSRLQGDPAGLGRMYRSALAVATAVSLPVHLFFVVAAPDAVAVFFGPRWVDAGPVMRVLALAGTAYTVFTVSDNCLTASGRPQVAFRIRLLGVLFLAALLVATVPHGIVWAATAVVAAAWLVVPLPVRALRRAGVTTYGQCARCVAGPVVAAVVMLGGLVAVAAAAGALAPVARLGLMVVTGAGVYLATLRLVDHGLLRHMRALVVPARRGPGERPR